MEINITILVQMVIFFFYISFCIKYIWPYVDKIIEKRKKKIYLENKKIKKIKNKFYILKKRIDFFLQKVRKKYSKIILNSKNSGISIIKKYKKNAKNKYKKILLQTKQKILLKKKRMYKYFSKNISKFINKILINITLNIFDKKLDNKFINKMLNKFKF